MIADLPFRGWTVAVLGLARSGRVAAEALARSGARVLAWDDAPAARAAAAEAGIPVRDLSAEPAAWDALVMSPGIPLTHDPHLVAARARAAGIPIIGDIELLWRARTGARFIGITGTNGKSTTTALIGHILKECGREVAVGGNLGIPVLSLPRLGPAGTYVIEMSSFQLDLCDSVRFDVAVLLNLTPDHLDRHGDMAGYIAAKRRIFRGQTSADTAIIGTDDEHSAGIAKELEEAGLRVVRISASQRLASGVSGLDGVLVEAGARVLDIKPIATLPGAHNWQNAAAACAACRAMDLSGDEIARAIVSYRGLPHRQEVVGRAGRVAFVNDSKATNADAAAKALGCYAPIYWIAGGVPKAGGIAPLRHHFPRVAHAYLIGAAAEDFAASIGAEVPVTLSGDLASAVRAAARDAAADPAPYPVVLLSPACASYDQFANFEERGDAFRALVADLAAVPA